MRHQSHCRSLCHLPIKPAKLPCAMLVSFVFFYLISSCKCLNNEPWNCKFLSPQVVQEVALKGRRCIIFPTQNGSHYWSVCGKWLPVTLTETFLKDFLNSAMTKKKEKKKKFKQYRIIAGGKKAMQSIVLFLAATALGCSKK